jgi:hypothetical protein
MYIVTLNLQNRKIQHKVIQQNIEAIRNKNLEVFLKNSIDNIEFLKEKNICSLGLYKEMACAFKTAVREDHTWMWVFKVYRLYRRDFRKMLINLPFVTETATDDTVYRNTICPNYTRFFKKKKGINTIFCHTLILRQNDEQAFCIYHKIALKKPKPLSKFEDRWPGGVIRKYSILTKKKYEKFYLQNSEVYEVLVLEEIQKRPLEYYTVFIGKITRQYFLVEKCIGVEWEKQEKL